MKRGWLRPPPMDWLPDLHIRQKPPSKKFPGKLYKWARRGAWFETYLEKSESLKKFLIIFSKVTLRAAVFFLSNKSIFIFFTISIDIFFSLFCPLNRCLFSCFLSVSGSLFLRMELFRPLSTQLG